MCDRSKSLHIARIIRKQTHSHAHTDGSTEKPFGLKFQRARAFVASPRVRLTRKVHAEFIRTRTTRIDHSF